MPECNIYDQNNKVISNINLNDAVFGVPVNSDLVYEVVKNHLANRRRGTASTKTKGQVSGGGQKPWRQKGTGRARVGSRQSPLWRSGGTVFGPLPRDYSYKVPKKVRRAALRSVLSGKFEEKKIVIIDNINLEEIKTKKALEVLNSLGIDNALIIIDKPNINLEKSVRNLPEIKILRVENLNVYDMISFDKLVLTKDSIEKIEGMLQ